MYNYLVGLKGGGQNETYWEVVAVAQPFSSKYYPAVVDGQVKSYFDFGSLDEYVAAKAERRRVTVRLTIAGNPVAAEEEIRARTGKQCLSTTPNSLDIYVEEDGP